MTWISNFFISQFDTTNLSPHGFCLYWDPALLTLTIMSNLFIALAYLAILIQLILFMRKHLKMLPLWFMVLFSSFILMCGISHALNIVTIFYPIYWVSSIESSLTAVVSVATAILFPAVIYKMNRSN